MFRYHDSHHFFCEVYADQDLFYNLERESLVKAVGKLKMRNYFFLFLLFISSRMAMARI